MALHCTALHCTALHCTVSDCNGLQVELYKEVKKNGSSRCVRAALLRFSALAPHIRPAKVSLPPS